jgi:hypothetical protein
MHHSSNDHQFAPIQQSTNHKSSRNDIGGCCLSASAFLLKTSYFFHTFAMIWCDKIGTSAESFCDTLIRFLSLSVLCLLVACLHIGWTSPHTLEQCRDQCCLLHQKPYHWLNILANLKSHIAAINIYSWDASPWHMSTISSILRPQESRALEPPS